MNTKGNTKPKQNRGKKDSAGSAEKPVPASAAVPTTDGSKGEDSKLPVPAKKGSKGVESKPPASSAAPAAAVAANGSKSVESKQNAPTSSNAPARKPINYMKYGYPTPSHQSPTPSDVMNNVFFLSPDQWESMRIPNLKMGVDAQQFDAIVIGTGFCGLGFVCEALQQNPHAKILMLERGTFFLPEHFQNLPLPFVNTLGGLSETFPFSLTSKTAEGDYIRWMHGMVPFFGGRSTLWSGWCPRPSDLEFSGWPQKARDDFDEFKARAERLLGVVTANEIGEHQLSGLSYVPVGRAVTTQEARALSRESKESTEGEHANHLCHSLQSHLKTHYHRPSDVSRAVTTSISASSSASLANRSSKNGGAAAIAAADASASCPYGTMQKVLYDMLQKGLDERKIEGGVEVKHAPLAVADPEMRDMIDFTKFSTPAKLLALVLEQRKLAQKKEGAPLHILTDCVVNRIIHQNNKAIALETSRGTINVGGAKLILGAGTIPNATLVLNSRFSGPGCDEADPNAKSVPRGVQNVGRRFTAHFITAITARVPRALYEAFRNLQELELAAIYFQGVDSTGPGPTADRLQWHVQLSALSVQKPDRDATVALRHMPDVVATASDEQLQQSKDYVVFVCAVLGEIDHNNPDNWLKLNDPLLHGGDLTTNALLQVCANERDNACWDAMDRGTLDMLKALDPTGGKSLEYWHPFAKPTEDGRTGEFTAALPTTDEIRVEGLVHEGSTMWVGGKDDTESPVDYQYKLRGTDNVYVTGGALWPRSGSWNPTLCMTALSMKLASNLFPPRV